jgi:hypothetical protein
MSDDKNVVLLLLRLEPGLRRSRSFEMLKTENQQLLVGILDPSQRKTSTPMTAISLQGNRRDMYNDILRIVKNLSEDFYQKDGYVDQPQRFGAGKKKELLDKIKKVGNLLYSLFNKADNPLGKWLDLTLDSESKMRHSCHQVTIITNDFSVPWPWFYKPVDDRFLCESCSLGIHQLEFNLEGDSKRLKISSLEDDDKEIFYRALLINGSSSIPFAKSELNKISEVLEAPTVRHSHYNWKADPVDSLPELLNVVGNYEDEKDMIQSFKILHFSGHYSENDLMINGKKINIDTLLKPVIKDSVLVLDGCSSSQGVSGWTDFGGLTSRLINLGALGCIVTILPIKHDPIVGDVFWGEFYKQLRLPESSIGQALLKARTTLKNYFKKLGTEDPRWLLYQLIGSPSVKLFEQSQGNDE